MTTLAPGKPRILKNAASYGLVQILQYLAPLVTVPLLTRALGTDQFGILVLAVLVGSYIALFMDFGFNVTANREIAVFHEDSEALDRIYWEVQAARAVLALIGSLLIVVSTVAFSGPKIEIPIVIATLGFAIGNLLLPLWYFEGQQKLREVAVALMTARILHVCAVLYLVRDPSGLWIAVLAESVTTLLAGLLLITRQPIVTGRWVRVPANVIFRRIRGNARLAFGIFSVTLYTSAHVAILALFAPASAVGLFALAERAVAAGKGALRPLVAALFPHLSTAASHDHGDYLTQRRIYMLLLLAIGALTSVGLFAFSETLVQLLAGREFGISAELLRFMSPIPLLVSVSNFYGVQTLLVLGHDRSFSKILTSIAMVGCLLSFALASQYGATGSAIAAVTSEALATIVMCVAAILVLRRLQ